MNRVLALTTITLLLVGCGGDDDRAITALTLHYGQDICAECSMIISEDRFAGAIGLRRDGRIVHLPFDDIGEMLVFEPEPSEEIRWFAKDASTREWLDAESAFFLRSDDLRTPMGTGVGAFATRAAAEAAQGEYGGEIMDFAALRPR